MVSLVCPWRAVFGALASVLFVLWFEVELYGSLFRLESVARRCVVADPETRLALADQPPLERRVYDYSASALVDVWAELLPADWHLRDWAVDSLPADLLPTRWLPPGATSDDCPAVRMAKQRGEDILSKQKPPAGHREVGDAGEAVETVGSVVLFAPSSVMVPSAAARRMQDRVFGVIEWPAGTIAGERVTEVCGGGRWASVEDGTFASQTWVPQQVLLDRFSIPGDALRTAARQPVAIPATEGTYDVSHPAMQAGFTSAVSGDGWLYSGSGRCDEGELRVQHRYSLLSDDTSVAAHHNGSGQLLPVKAIATAVPHHRSVSDLLFHRAAPLIRFAAVMRLLGVAAIAIIGVAIIGTSAVRSVMCATYVIAVGVACCEAVHPAARGPAVSDRFSVQVAVVSVVLERAGSWLKPVIQYRYARWRFSGGYAKGASPGAVEWMSLRDELVQGAPLKGSHHAHLAGFRKRAPAHEKTD
eukprot:TRINITY_DN43510_c0_g1_i1.p1 TRINITY_DN43510_c0_g1~~TRINITY_DN43510_c0_g1_i1.p1  ORF type:complete len:473 (+),score=137.77 TRINITY_DN43510_c0_g1_i1:44-1462(+)